MADQVISGGDQASILAALKDRRTLWVKGNARATVRLMAQKGLVGFSAEAICDNRTSRSHEELFVWLNDRNVAEPLETA